MWETDLFKRFPDHDESQFFVKRDHRFARMENQLPDGFLFRDRHRVLHQKCPETLALL